MKIESPSKYCSYRSIIVLTMTFMIAGCLSSVHPEVQRSEVKALPVSTTSVSDRVVTLSVVGTNDIHGQLLPAKGRGGLAALSGYVDALRNARAETGGAVLLIDAGDMWQGTLESNSSEGATALEAFNRLGYTAAAIGNHEFDFGPVGALATPQSPEDDARGVLKLRASEANFPLLAANLIDTATEKPVNWANVHPSVMVAKEDIKVGIIGVMTIEALSATMSANTKGLRVAPLAPVITEEATKLRQQGANIIIVTAHAGGSCREFENSANLSSCEQDAEIMQVARDIPVGLVDHIVAGHRHRGMAHIVNGIAITSNFGSSSTFGRVDFVVDQRTKQIIDKRVFAPYAPCPALDSITDECVWINDLSRTLKPARYENQDVIPMARVAEVVQKAADQTNQLKNKKIGIVLDTPITNDDRPESALGNLFTDALLATSGADVAIHNVAGGLRANLPAGDLTFGSVYQMFPFDNRVVKLEITGLDLRRIVEQQSIKQDRRAGIAGFRVFVTCDADIMKINMVRVNGLEIYDGDRITLAVNDFLAMGGDDILAPIIPVDGFDFADDTPLARDEFVAWLRDKGGHINAQQFTNNVPPRWNLPGVVPATCTL